MAFYIIFMLIGIAIDQSSKYWAATYLADVYTVPIIPHVLHLTYVENSGAAFSILEGRQIFLIIITILFVAVLFYLFIKTPKNRKYFDVNLALSMVISGAIGNLIDRIRLNYVIDFFDIRLIGFAIFNIADVLVVVGCILIVIALLRNKELLNDSPSHKPTSKRMAINKKIQHSDITSNPTSHTNTDSLFERNQSTHSFNPNIDFTPTPPSESEKSNKKTEE